VNDPYQRLVELGRRELELLNADDYDSLPELWAERERLIAGLPASPPVSAREALEAAAALVRLREDLLGERLADADLRLRRLARGRTALSGYAPAMGRVPLVDRAG
jgi:hypothetical protein